MKNYWFFKTPFLSFGQGALDFLENIPGKKCLIVTDPGIIKVKLLELLTVALNKYNKEYTVFGEVEPDPHEETVFKGLQLAKNFQPEIIIGLGGGSSIDTAKAIWVLYERPELKFEDINPFSPLGLGKKAQMVAIPTTSGTGAEATWAAVITRVKADGVPIKLELANREIIPTYAILDPEFTKGLPIRITVATAFDAVTHAFEGLISQWHNDFSEGLCINGLRLIRQYLPQVVKNPGDLQGREKLHNAASMIGVGFGNSQVIMAHALGHAIGAIFKIVHGESVGVFIVPLLQYMTHDSKEPGSLLAQQILGNAAKMIGVAEWKDSIEIAVHKLIADMKQFQEEMKFPRSLKALRITAEQLNEKIHMVISNVMESMGTALNPRPMTQETYKKILFYTLEGKDIDF